ncbi:alpha-galactosidase [Paenibacillus antri]|uniref:alpha-galactosidase n=1 Tax=Paenibacillus antri TaxID=2582848 RepID=A0A5R9GHQ1_9BACL|nr:alpha-galactosidase [Paenibacillus antri]TLS54006.1 alpha-galactosidase [Paenibacillus antri]
MVKTNDIGFALRIDGSYRSPAAQGMSLTGSRQTKEGGRVVDAAFFVDDATGVQVERRTIRYDGTNLAEQRLIVRNEGTRAARIEAIDTIALELPVRDYETMHYTSGWGMEFENVLRTLPPHGQPFRLETRKGRSSADVHPWVALFDRASGLIVTASVMWSGNWALTLAPKGDGAMLLTGGLNDWEFWKELAPGESMESPGVVVASADTGDLNDVSIQYARVGREYWYPRNELSASLPAEWNHWWSYEDKAINEEVFLANVEKAAAMGIDVCTLDAGWFGPTDPDTHWYDYRGDWDLVNTIRFPNGLRVLSDACHERGMKFGLWCEIEALGRHAELARSRPDFVALRDGEPLGYVCFANPAAAEWAFETLDRIITEHNCDWIKLDYNLDPGAGCNRTDHGHGGGDGLFEHIAAYYRLLERVRAKHPRVLLESCSSGGLRIDLGLMRQTHATFLSDPDWPEHDLQLFWGATTMLAPNACLHWGYCDWLGEHRYQKFDPRDPALTREKLDYYTHISMLGGFGFSQKLPDLPDWVAERFAYHIQTYRDVVADFVRSADVYRLTDQPKRFARGERWAAFQYAMPGGEEHLLFAFRLHGPQGRKSRSFDLRALDASARYAVSPLDGGEPAIRTGAEMMEEGLTFALREEESALVRIRKEAVEG